MNVLVTFALGHEFAPWRKRRSFVAVPVADLTLHTTRVGAADVYVLLAGVGPAKAAASVRGFLVAAAESGSSFDVCIVAGLAGGLRPGHRPADMLVGRAVVAAPELRDSSDEKVVQMDADLVGLAEATRATCVDHFCTVSRVIGSAAEKAQLGTLADAVDMETFAVASEARAWGARPVAIRAISDTVDEDLPFDFNPFFDEAGHVNTTRALAEILRRPHRVPALIGFARRSRRAAENLCAFLDRYIEALAEQGTGARAEEFDEVAAT